MPSAWEQYFQNGAGQDTETVVDLPSPAFTESTAASALTVTAPMHQGAYALNCSGCRINLPRSETRKRQTVFDSERGCEPTAIATGHHPLYSQGRAPSKGQYIFPSASVKPLSHDEALKPSDSTGRVRIEFTEVHLR